MKFSRLVLLGGVVGAAGYWLSRHSHSAINSFPLRNSVVLITGASSGIGRAYAMAFARRGARIVLAARRAELLEEVRQEIAPFAEDILIVPTDVTDESQLQNLVSATLDKFGRIDILINNAGVASGGPLHTIPLKVIRSTINVNLTSALMLTNLCLPAMLAQRSGLVINIASIFGGISIPFYGVYATTKHGLVAFSNLLRRELDGTGVGVVSVMPTWTTTEMLTPETQKSIEQSGMQIDTASHVAERTVEGILDGKTEIIFGGSQMQIGFWLDRHFPALMDIYFRATVTPDMIAASRGG